MKRTLIIAAVLLSTVVFALPASAVQVNEYIDGPWLKFFFGSSYSSAYGNCPGTSCALVDGTNFVDLGASPWTLSLTDATEMRITDAFMKGDTFAVFDNGTQILETPGVEVTYSVMQGAVDPEFCYYEPGFSRGSVILAPGDHSLTINVLYSPHNAGVAFFRLNSVSVPEPLSLILLGLGLLALSAFRRSG